MQWRSATHGRRRDAAVSVKTRFPTRPDGPSVGSPRSAPSWQSGCSEFDPSYLQCLFPRLTTAEARVFPLSARTIVTLTSGLVPADAHRRAAVHFVQRSSHSWPMQSARRYCSEPCSCRSGQGNRRASVAHLRHWTSARKPPNVSADVTFRGDPEARNQRRIDTFALRFFRAERFYRWHSFATATARDLGITSKSIRFERSR